MKNNSCRWKLIIKKRFAECYLHLQTLATLYLCLDSKIISDKNDADMSNLDYKGKKNEITVGKKKKKDKGNKHLNSLWPNKRECKKWTEKMVNDGKYTIGELIVPQKYEKQ